jgi:hypothetical protein
MTRHRAGEIGTGAILDRMQHILPGGEIPSGGGPLESAGHLVMNGDLETLAVRGFSRSHV